MATIGIDVDGVLADFTNPYCALLTKESGVEFPIAGANWPTTWFFERDLFHKLGYSSEEAKAIENRVWQRAILPLATFWKNLPILPEGRETLNYLQSLSFDGHDVYFITARPGLQAKWQTEEWLKSHGYPNPTVIISNNKGLIAAGLDLDIFIDDRPENCEDVAVVRKSKTKVYLINKPYNQDALYGVRVLNALAALDDAIRVVKAA